MIGQACAPRGFVAVAATTATAMALASVIVTGTTHFVVPNDANLALIVVEGTAVRWRDDNTAPTPSSGMIAEPTVAPWEYSGNVNALQFCAVAVSATVDVSLYKQVG